MPAQETSDRRLPAVRMGADPLARVLSGALRRPGDQANEHPGHPRFGAIVLSATLSLAVALGFGAWAAFYPSLGSHRAQGAARTAQPSGPNGAVVAPASNPAAAAPAGGQAGSSNPSTAAAANGGAADVSAPPTVLAPGVIPSGAQPGQPAPPPGPPPAAAPQANPSVFSGPSCSAGGAKPLSLFTPGGSADGWQTTGGGAGLGCGSPVFSHQTGSPTHWEDDATWVFFPGTAVSSCTFSIHLPDGAWAADALYYVHPGNSANGYVGPPLASFHLNQQAAAGGWTSRGPFSAASGVLDIELTDAGTSSASVVADVVSLSCS